MACEANENTAVRGLIGWLTVVCVASLAALTRAQGVVERVEISTIESTQAATILELLPRPPPTSYSPAELDDFARRVSALSVFDQVAVEQVAGTLHVRVREKWTLIPNFSLMTGHTMNDLTVQLGIEEYNLAGHAARAVLNLVREERGYGFLASTTEHPYRLHRWSWGAQAMYRAASYRFPREDVAWTTWQGRGGLAVTSPPLLSPFFRYSLSAAVQHDNVVNDKRALPQGDELSLGVAMTLTFDRYHWDDLVPTGVQANLDTAIGMSVYEPRARHSVAMTGKFAIPLWRLAVVAGRTAASVSSRGNPHASTLVGSIDGVRGLPDGLYRNWLNAQLNIELRQSVRIFARLALQLAAFSDGACFESMSSDGGRGFALCALSLGVGLRIVPTFVSNAVLRLDIARLMAPKQAWFPQLAFAQYF